jgi:hypothetical protein
MIVGDILSQNLQSGLIPEILKRIFSWQLYDDKD